LAKVIEIFIKMVDFFSSSYAKKKQMKFFLNTVLVDRAVFCSEPWKRIFLSPRTSANGKWTSAVS